VAALCLALGALGACAESEPPRTAADASPEDAALLRVVENYVETNRGWPKDSFRAEMTERDSNSAFVRVVFLEEERTGRRSADGRRSFAVDVDVRTRRVLGEARFR
jgi:hypothetical protein